MRQLFRYKSRQSLLQNALIFKYKVRQVYYKI